MEHYSIKGMSCAACSARVEKAVSGVAGVTECSVNLLTNSMTVEGTADSKAIEKGNKNAMIDLAECYKNGSIVRQDYGESMKYYQMAAELDKIDNNTKDTNQLKALFAIGTFYENGYGVDKNSSKAIFWYRKAANKNYTPAQEALKRLDTNWVDETGHATRGKENNNINDELPF